MYIFSLLKILQGCKKKKKKKERGAVYENFFHPFSVKISEWLLKNKPSLSTWSPDRAVLRGVVFTQHTRLMQSMKALLRLYLSKSAWKREYKGAFSNMHSIQKKKAEIPTHAGSSGLCRPLSRAWTGQPHSAGHQEPSRPRLH